MTKFCVIGLGKFGYHIAEELARTGGDVLGVDASEARVAAIRDIIAQSVCTEIVDENSLHAIGIKGIDIVIVALGRNFGQSVLITQLLKKNFEIPMVIVRATNAIERDILETLGADQVILPEDEAATRLADSLNSPFPAIIRITNDFSIVQLVPPAKFVGKTIEELFIRETYGVECLAIKRDEHTLLATFEQRVGEDDILFFAGNNGSLQSLAKL